MIGPFVGSCPDKGLIVYVSAFYGCVELLGWYMFPSWFLVACQLMFEHLGGGSPFCLAH